MRRVLRADPFFDGLWESYSSAIWSRRDVLEQAAQVVGARNRWMRPLPRDEALGRLAQRRSRLDLLAAVRMWGTLTTQQVVAFTGCGRHASIGSEDYWLAYSAGLLKVGRPSGLTAAGWLPDLVNFNPDPGWDALRDFVTFDQWCGVTGGRSRADATHGDRHNVLSAELGLRIAENLPVPACFGESMAAASLLAPVSGRRSGDVLAVRADGMRIVFEVTASTRGAAAKAEHWARVLQKATPGSLAVVFVTAFAPWGKMTHASVRQAVADAAAADLSRVTSGVASRLAVADWREWFPARLEMSEAFGALEAKTLTPTGAWAPVGMLDPFAAPGPDDPQAAGVLGQLRHVWGAPSAQRDAAPHTPPPSAQWALAQWAS